jgi:hypothetical protein
MKIPQTVFVCLTIIVSSCQNRLNTINPELIKNDWICGNDNLTPLMIQDSLMFEWFSMGEYPISPYKVSNDTLIVYSQDFDYERNTFITKRIEKFQILSVDSLFLLIKPICPSCRDTIIFRKMDLVKKNDLKIKRLEFSYHSGYVEFSQDLRIDNDSLMYHYGYSNTSICKGLTKHKLSSKEFQSIQNKVYAIDRDSLVLSKPFPVTQYYYLYIETEKDTIQISGYPRDKSDDNLQYLIDYLLFLERFFNIKDAEESIIEFRDKTNTETFGNK